MPDGLDWSWAAGLCEFAGGLWVVAYCLMALSSLIRTHDVQKARHWVSEGALTGLTFKLAGTLLVSLGAPSWEHLARLAVMIALRTLLKRFFTWEEGRLGRP